MIQLNLKILKVAILSSFFIVNHSIAQNFINNPSFESPGGPLNCKPWNIGQLFAANSWEDGTGMLGSDITSPDWYKNCDRHIRLTENSLIEIDASQDLGNGCGYVGMWNNEIIQQKIGGINGLPIIQYKVIIRGRRINGNLTQNKRESCFTHNLMDGSIGNNISETVLNILISTERMEYESRGVLANPTGQKIKILESIPYEQFSTQFWSAVTSFVSIPTNDKYKWIGFELVSEFSPQTSQTNYMILDDIEMFAFDENICANENSCSPTDGCIDITFHNNPASHDKPFGISGLGNVSSFFMQISTSLGQEVKTIEFLNPPPLVEWDGRDDDLNPITTTNNFKVNIILVNDNDQVAIFGMGIELNLTNFPPDFYCETMSYIPINKDFIYEECCNECQIYNNETLNFCPGEPDPYVTWGIDRHLEFLPNEILAPGKIIVENVHFTTESVSFMAADNIELLPSTIFDPATNSTTFTMFIEELCPPMIVDPIVSDQTQNRIEQDIEQKPSTQPFDFSFDFFISPNPSSYIANIRFNSELIDITSVTVYDLTGAIRYTETLRNGASTLQIFKNQIGEGVFFITVQHGSKILTKKLVFN